MERNIYKIGKELFITSDEEIKEGDFVFNLISKEVYPIFELWEVVYYEKKIILTTDQDLIKDGVQAIDDEFFWFVKNPSCESVDVEESNLLNTSRTYLGVDKYKIIIPKEEPKQDLEKEMFELEQQLDIPSHLRWHNSKPKKETLEEVGAYQQKLFNYLHDLGIIALQSEMHEIERIVLSMQDKKMYSALETAISLLKQTTEFEVLDSWKVKVRELEQFKKK